MNRVAHLAAGVAVFMTVAGPAAAYVPFRTDGGVAYRWPQTCVPMVVYPNDLAAMMPVEEILAAVSASASAWSAGANPCSYLQITVASSTDQVPRAKIDGTNNIIFRRVSWCKLADTGACDPAAPPYDQSALALTSVSAGAMSGTIRDVDMEVNAFGFQWADLASHPELRGMRIHDLENAVTHEMGHVIGLTHTCFLDPPPLLDDMGQPTPDCINASLDVMATTMFPSANPGDIEKRTLEADDKRAVCETYPAAQDPMMCGAKEDGCGCRAARTPASASGAMLVLAAMLLALRARRRRRA